MSDQYGTQGAGPLRMGMRFSGRPASRSRAASAGGQMMPLLRARLTAAERELTWSFR